MSEAVAENTEIVVGEKYIVNPRYLRNITFYVFEFEEKRSDAVRAILSFDSIGPGQRMTVVGESESLSWKGVSWEEPLNKSSFVRVRVGETEGYILTYHFTQAHVIVKPSI